MKKKQPEKTKFDWLSYLLGQYGYGHMGADEFWRRMKERGFVQDDIDWWLAEDRRREKEHAEENGTTRGTTARDARGQTHRR